MNGDKNVVAMPTTNSGDIMLIKDDGLRNENGPPITNITVSILIHIHYADVCCFCWSQFSSNIHY